MALADSDENKKSPIKDEAESFIVEIFPLLFPVSVPKEYHYVI
jgi:hypothetical protein